MFRVTYPLDVSGARVLVVGGSSASLGTVAGLLDAGARVTVVAVEVVDSLRDLAERGLVDWRQREPVATDVADFDVALRPGRTPAPRPDPSGDRADASAESAGRDHSPVAGRVTLVGGGPGDPGLITVAGLDAVRAADVVVCDRLAPLALLDQLKPGAEVVDVGKIPRGRFTPQERINEVLIEHARTGRDVVRLKGGDNFVFGRGGEEWQACATAGIEVTVVPGITSATAVPALAGIPVTHRDLSQGFTVVSGHLPPGHPKSTLDWDALARSGTTLVILMGVANLVAITDHLTGHGLGPDTPAAVVADGGLPSMRTARGSLADIAELVAERGIGAPAVIVVGATAGFDPAG